MRIYNSFKIFPEKSANCACFFHNIQVVYTKENQTADNYIESLVNEIGRNYDVKVATSDALIQLSSLRSGVLRMSARELWQEVAQAEEQMQKYYKA